MNDHVRSDPLSAASQQAGIPTLCNGLRDAVVQGVRNTAAATKAIAERRDLQSLSQVLEQRGNALAEALAVALQQAPALRKPSPRTATLELVEDRQIERDIEVMRAVQQVRDAAEWEMRDYESLLVAQQPRGGRRSEPLSPSACVNALLAAFEQLGFEHADCLLLLRAAKPALAAWFCEHCAEQSRRLRERGLVPVPFAVVAGARPAPVSAHREEIAYTTAVRHEEPVRASVPDRRAGPVGLGLLLQCLGTRQDAHQAGTADGSPLPAPALVEKLQRLLQEGADMAGAEPTRPAPLEATSEAMQFQAQPQGQPLRHPQAGEPTRPGLLTSLRVSIHRRKLEAILRRQIKGQLQDADTEPGLRSFLLSPWVLALTETLLHHGPDSPVTRRVFQCSDHLIDHVAPQGVVSQGFASADERDALLDTVEEALGLTLLPPDRVLALSDLLADLLPQPPEPVREALPEETVTEPATEPRDAGWIDTVDHAVFAGGSVAATGAELHTTDWLDSLEPKQSLMLQIDSRWTSAQLLWRSANRQFFLFGSQHAGRTHSMSRRALLQMRSDGRVELLNNTPSAGRVAVAAP